jgi:hypothetical protein
MRQRLELKAVGQAGDQINAMRSSGFRRLDLSLNGRAIDRSDFGRGQPLKLADLGIDSRHSLPRYSVMAPVDAVWREAGFAKVAEHRCVVGEPQTDVKRVNPMRDRRRRVGALDDECD